MYESFDFRLAWYAWARIGKSFSNNEVIAWDRRDLDITDQMQVFQKLWN